MSGDMLIDRQNWLGHLHECPECERRHLCRIGRYLVRVMAAGMTRDESLPRWFEGIGPAER